MSLFESYLERSREIIGERSPEEMKYDAEVLRWLRMGKKIRGAIEAANRSFPDEALEVDESNVADVDAHYKYIREHEKIMKRMKKQAARR